MTRLYIDLPNVDSSTVHVGYWCLLNAYLLELGPSGLQRDVCSLIKSILQ